MIWNGTKELVIGEVGDNNKVIKEYRVKPGEEIPKDALELIAEAEGGAVPIPYDSAGGYSKKFIEKAYASGDPHKHYRDKLS